MCLEIKKLTPDLVEDFFSFFDRIAFAVSPEWGCDCYCCFFHAENAKEWEAQTGAQNAALARQMILQERMNGCLAYMDGKPVAWCHFDDKSNFPGLQVFYPETGSKDANIGAIVCFTVAQGYRGKGIAKSMLAFACKKLQQQGFEIAEAYPKREATSNEEHYHGPLSMYLADGFSIYKEISGQTIVRKVIK